MKKELIVETASGSLYKIFVESSFIGQSKFILHQLNKTSYAFEEKEYFIMGIGPSPAEIYGQKPDIEHVKVGMKIFFANEKKSEDGLNKTGPIKKIYNRTI